MKRLIAAVAPKGGVGKSKTVKGLYDILGAHSRKIAAFDLDESNASFASYDPEHIKVCASGDSAAWLDAAYDDSIDDVIVDVPGGHTAAFAERVAGSPAALADVIADAKRELVIVTVVGVESDETMHALATLETWAKTSARVCVLLNGRDGDPGDFLIFNDEVADAVSAAGASTLWLPRIPSRLRAILSQRNITMRAATTMQREIGIDASVNAKYYLTDLAIRWKGTWLDADGDGDGSVRISLPGLTTVAPRAAVTV